MKDKKVMKQSQSNHVFLVYCPILMADSSTFCLHGWWVGLGGRAGGLVGQVGSGVGQVGWLSSWLVVCQCPGIKVGWFAYSWVVSVLHKYSDSKYQQYNLCVTSCVLLIREIILNVHKNRANMVCA